jgi:RNA polymerase sigma factor (sigma-70 family)
MTNKNYNSEHIIDEILSGREAALRTMYPRYQKSFMAWARSWSYDFDEDTLIEAYMEAVKVFYINVRSGNLTCLKSSVENYLIGVGKYYLMKKAKQNNKILPVDKLDFNLSEDENFLTQTIESELDNERKTKLRKAFAQLGEQCQQLLTLAFFENKKAPDIKHLMNFENENTVYASRSRCLSKLRKLILNLK